MKRFICLSTVCLLLSFGCRSLSPSDATKIVVNCTMDAIKHANLTNQVVTALGEQDWKKALLSLQMPIGMALAEDIACILKEFLFSKEKKYLADPLRVQKETRAREYLKERRYEVE